MDSEDRYYLGDQALPLNSDQESAKLVHRLRQYLDVRNLALLVGNGASLPLGAPSIGDARAIRPELEVPECGLDDASAQGKALAAFDRLTVRGGVGVEALLGTIYHFLATRQTLGSDVAVSVGGEAVDFVALGALDRLLKKWLWRRCQAVGGARGDEDPLANHRELLRRLLMRPLSLPRLKVFTTNYDLALERALDQMGVAHFDGFVGSVERTLRSESYHYDLYFPGETTEGRVSRVDRVVQLYKLHGSVNWRRRQGREGLDVVIDHTVPTDAETSDVMIYPSPLKVTETHGYPYAEMLRLFGAQIHQPQCVLLAIGYSFGDDHINRLIYQALSVPSFVLVIVLPTVDTPGDGATAEARHEVWRLINRVRSKRIVVVTGGRFQEGAGFVGGAGTLQDFAQRWLPDIDELAIETRVQEEVGRLAARSEPPVDGEV